MGLPVRQVLQLLEYTQLEHGHICDERCSLLISRRVLKRKHLQCSASNILVGVCVANLTTSELTYRGE